MVSRRAPESPGEVIVEPGASVLFVCLGNICRSPTAEGVFREAVKKAGLAEHIRVESAGLGDYHVGTAPDRRAVEAAKRRGYDISMVRARQVDAEYFGRFGWIIAMDNANLRALAKIQPPEYTGHMGLLLDYAPDLGVREVPDPYYGAPAGFDRVLDLVEAGVAGLLDRMRASVGTR